jgi:hypothetical protein
VLRVTYRLRSFSQENSSCAFFIVYSIELEPMSKDVDRYAIDDGMEAQLRRVEIESLNRYLKSLYKNKEGETAGTGNGTSTTDN